MINPWKVLGVHRKSTKEDIRNSYISLAKKHHPDTKKGNVDKFHAVTQAYEILKDDKKVETLKALYNTCKICAGVGCTSRSKGLHQKVYTACKVCNGAGLIINEENDNVTIELGRTDGTSSKRGNSKRRS